MIVFGEKSPKWGCRGISISRVFVISGRGGSLSEVKIGNRGRGGDFLK